MRYEVDPQVVSLLAGHFDGRGAAYRVARPSGSGSWLLIVTVGGAGRVGSSALPEGRAALLAPRHPQAYRTDPAIGRWDLRWAHFHPRPEWLPLLALPETQPGLRLVDLDGEAPAVADALERARQHGARTGDLYEEWLAMGALEEALVRTRRAVARATATGDPRVRAAVAFARQRLAEPIGPAEIARAVGLSPSRLGALFRAEVGVSPRAFVERERLLRARGLLAMTDLSVRAVAAEVGFASEFYFANRFRAATGASPSGYRVACRDA